MGMRATLTLISSKDYAALVKDPKADFATDGLRVDIDKTWSDFHEYFRRSGSPLKFAIEGKYCPYGNFQEIDDGMAIGFVSAAVAAKISEALKKVPFKTIFDSVEDRYKELGLKMPGGEKKYLQTHFSQLKKVYAAAAKQKMAVWIDIC